MKKKSSKDKQAAKLKALRKEVNAQQTNLALAMTKAVDAAFNKVGINDIWGRLDAYRAIHKDEWFHRCFIPHNTAEEMIFSDFPEEGKRPVDLSNILPAVEFHIQMTGNQLDKQSACENIWMREWEEATHLLSIVGAWRQHKEIFAFDADFLDNLLMDDDKIYTAGVENIITPKELETLPFPAFFVDAHFDSPAGPCGGFFFCYDTLKGHAGTDHLVFYFVNPISQNTIDVALQTSMLLGNAHFQQITFDLHADEPNMSVWECYQKDCRISESIPTNRIAVDTIQKQKDSFALLFKGLQIITYLASQFADVRENPQQKRVHKHFPIIQDKPTEIRKWDVGIRMGNVIRAANKEEVKEDKAAGVEKEEKTTEPKPHKPSGPKKPHSRRAHWQYYWYGKKDGTEVRYRRLKFVEATFVNFKEVRELDEIPAVYHPVMTF